MQQQQQHLMCAMMQLEYHVRSSVIDSSSFIAAERRRGSVRGHIAPAQTHVIPIRWFPFQPFPVNQSPVVSLNENMIAGSCDNPEDRLILSDVIVEADGRRYLTTKREPLKLAFDVGVIDEPSVEPMHGAMQPVQLTDGHHRGSFRVTSIRARSG